MVPFLDLTEVNRLPIEDFKKDLDQFLKKSIYIGGEELSLFEKSFAQFSGSNYAIGVSNGLDALVIALQTLGISKGDEVIIPSNTFIATALAVSRLQAKIILADPDPETWNLTLESVRNYLSPKTKAIIAVNLYGLPAELDELSRYCNENNIYLIEDNAQSQGAAINSKKTGNFGILNATSFYPGKNLGGLGDGGCLTSNDFNLATTARAISNYGSEKKYVHDIHGGNYRLDPIQALFLNHKLKYLELQNEERNRIALKYRNGLSGIEGLQMQHVPQNYYHVYHLFVIKTAYRDELMSHLAKNQVQTLIHYPIPISNQNLYKDDYLITSPFSIEHSNSILSIPCYPGLSEIDQSYVIDKIIEFYKSK